MSHPDLTLRLLIIIIFLSLVAIGNVLGVYENILAQNSVETVNSAVSVLIYGIPAYGLLKLRPWARMTELILSAILVILGLILITSYSFLIGAFIIITHGLIAAYLLTNECKKSFGLIGNRPAD